VETNNEPGDQLKRRRLKESVKSGELTAREALELLPEAAQGGKTHRWLERRAKEGR
jgi:hypothetical protein